MGYPFDVRTLRRTTSFLNSLQFTQQDAGLQTYLNVLQHAIDAVDPVNFVADLQNAVISEVDGDNTTINDGRVNNLEGLFPGEVGGQIVQVDMDSSKAPLSGSTPLSEFMGANRLTIETGNVMLPAFVRFTDEASHTTPVLPDQTKPLAVATFGQMVAQTLSLVSLNDLDSVAVVENGSEASVISD